VSLVIRRGEKYRSDKIAAIHFFPCVKFAWEAYTTYITRYCLSGGTGQLTCLIYTSIDGLGRIEISEWLGLQRSGSFPTKPDVANMIK